MGIPGGILRPLAFGPFSAISITVQAWDLTRICDHQCNRSDANAIQTFFAILSYLSIALYMLVKCRHSGYHPSNSSNQFNSNPTRFQYHSNTNPYQSKIYTSQAKAQSMLTTSITAFHNFTQFLDSIFQYWINSAPVIIAATSSHRTALLIALTYPFLVFFI